MSQFNEIFRSLDKSQNLAYAFIRIFLGVVLFIRGWILVSKPEEIIALVGEEKLHRWFSYVTILHLLGGISIALGFFTRIGSLLQIPILFSAVFIVHLKAGLMRGDQSLELASLVLFILVIFLLFGSGPFSLDRYFNRHNIQEKEGVGTPSRIC